MKKELICFLFLILFLIPVMISMISAAEIHAASCSYEDVSAAINSAENGDTVVVPAGICIWDRQLVIRKGISLIGAGTENTIIRSGFSGTRFWANNFLLSIELSTNPFKHFRLSGFTFDANQMSCAVSVGNADSSFNPVWFRMDNCRIDNLSSSTGVDMFRSFGVVYGSIDNNIFNPSGSTMHRIGMFGSGQNTWLYLPFDFGTEKNIYFENNTFYWRTGYIWEGGHGGYYAVRHNQFYNVHPTYTNTQFADMHGNYGGNIWSTIGAEMYENRIDLGVVRNTLLQYQRGGKFLAYNNYAVNGYGVNFAVWEEDRGDAHDGFNYPYVHAITGQPQHPSNTYIWNTYYNNNKLVSESLPYVTTTINYSDPNVPGYQESIAHFGVVPRNDFSFWREVNNFNGSTGMGVGLLSERPVSCTLEGAGYWATDEEKLYRCKNGAWELYYVPYIYPHPLIVAPFGTDICREGEIISECWCEGMKSLGYCYNGYYYTEEGEIIPDPITPTLNIVTLQDMLGAYQQYKRNEVTLAYFLDKLRRWIVFW